MYDINDFNLICVDFQNDFVNKDGKNFNKGESVLFIKNEFIPYLLRKKILVSEIRSDYRLPRGKSKNESCVPGTSGFESLLPRELLKSEPWIKCMHNPLWIRKNIGKKNKKIGMEYQDPKAFNKWIKKNLDKNKVILFGETADCCLLQVASELYFRGYDVYYIYEATDPMNERIECKNLLLNNSTISIYVKTLYFKDFI